MVRPGYCYARSLPTTAVSFVLLNFDHGYFRQCAARRQPWQHCCHAWSSSGEAKGRIVLAGDCEDDGKSGLVGDAGRAALVAVEAAAGRVKWPWAWPKLLIFVALPLDWPRLRLLRPRRRSAMRLSPDWLRIMGSAFHAADDAAAGGDDAGPGDAVAGQMLGDHRTASRMVFRGAHTAAAGTDAPDADAAPDD